MNLFDNRIREKLKDTEMNVSDGLWLRIESQIPTKDEKSRLGYWYLGAGLIAAAIMVASLFLLSQKTTSQKTASSQAQATDTTLPVSEDGNVSGELSLDKQPQNEGDHPSNEDTDVPSKRSYTSPSIKEVNNNTASTNSSTQANNDFPYPTQSASISESVRHDVIDNLAMSARARQEGGEMNSDLLSEIRDLSSDKKLTIIRKPIAELSLNSSKGTNLQLIEKSRIFEGINQISKVKSLSLLELSAVDIVDEKRLVELNNKILGLKKPTPVCPSFEKFKSGLYFFAETRIGLASQHLEPKGDNNQGEAITLVQNRNMTESGSLSSSFNLGIGKIWPSNMILESGINIDRISMKFNFVENVPGHTIIVVDSFPEISMDTIHVQPTTIEHTSRNTFRQINIPVLLGYAIHLSDNLSLVPKAGILVNLSSKNQGSILGEQGPIVFDSDQISTSLFRTNLGLAYMGSLDVQTNISTNLSGYLGLNFQHYPSDFGIASYPVSQTFSKYGFTLGLKYSL